jgi:hypothetical protein
MGTSVSQPRQRGLRWWLTLAVEVATVLALVVAVVALLLDHSPFGGRSGGTSPGAAGTSGPNPVRTSEPGRGPTSAAAQPTAASTRYLTDLATDSGGGNVQRVGSHSLRMACGSGDSDDRFREVSYVLPPAVTYRSFTSTVSAAGARDTRIQALLLIDDQQVTAPLVPTGSKETLAWSGERAGRVTLRIVCDAGATTATFTDPLLSG